MSFYDCTQHGPQVDNELIVVEGLSAADNIKRGRDATTQAVLAMQGKPINAAKASATRVHNDLQLQALTQALGCGTANHFDLSLFRYQRLVLLMDPDADGIHCGALLQIFLQQYLPALIDAGKLMMVRAPLREITVPGHGTAVYAYSEHHYQKLCEHFEQQGIGGYSSKRFKGVASLDVPLLRASCLHRATRQEQLLTRDDTAMAVRVFA